MINEIIQGDIREIAKQLETGSVNCIVTSPPYWGLRDYGVSGQIGLEPTPEEYVTGLVAVFRELRRVLRDDGTLWLNLGDSYAGNATGAMSDKSNLLGGKTTQIIAGNRPNKMAPGLKSKDLVGIPWRVALALQADGWYLRLDIIWNKPNCMPESVTDRPTKAHEYLFLLAKSEEYYYDQEAIAEQTTDFEYRTKGKIRPSQYTVPMPNGGDYRKAGGLHNQPGGRETRNRRSVWDVTTQPYKGAHFAVFPPDLIEPCILAGCAPGGVVLDPFFGSGTTGQVCVETGRNWLGVELNPKYIKLAKKRIAGAQPPLIVVGSTPPSNNPLQPNGYQLGF